MREVFTRAVGAAVSAFSLGLLAPVASLAQTVDVPTRPGVTQRVLKVPPAQPVKASVVLMVGGHGGLQISPSGELGWGAGNFLARTRALFAAQGLAVALVDAPSDRQRQPFLSGVRQEPDHTQDLKAVIVDMRQRFGKPVVLVGTSRGTQSVAAAALGLQDSGSGSGSGSPDGLVLTASILSDGKSRALPQMALDQLRLPVLVAHHEQDVCGVSRYSDLDLLTRKITAPLTVLRYQGGNDVGDACEARAYHGFNGLEARVVEDIAQWITKALAP